MALPHARLRIEGHERSEGSLACRQETDRYCEVVRGGGHIVLSDDIKLTYAEYVDLNERFGKMLGLNRR